MAKGNAIKQPAGRVHNDYTTKSAPQRVRDLMGEEAEELLKRRFQIVMRRSYIVRKQAAYHKKSRCIRDIGMCDCDVFEQGAKTSRCN